MVIGVGTTDEKYSQTTGTNTVSTGILFGTASKPLSSYSKVVQYTKEILAPPAMVLKNKSGQLVRSATRSRLGQATLYGLDAVISVSEYLLDKISPPDGNTEPDEKSSTPLAKRRLRSDVTRRETQSEIPPAHSAHDVEKNALSKACQTTKQPGILRYYLLIKPLQVWIGVLRYLRRGLKIARRRTRSERRLLATADIDRQAAEHLHQSEQQIAERVKVAPIRRRYHSFPQRLVNSALTMVGLRRTYSNTNPDQHELQRILKTDPSPSKIDIHKRKYEEVFDDDITEESYGDWSDYDSALDSDYEAVSEIDSCEEDLSDSEDEAEEDILGLLQEAKKICQDGGTMEVPRHLNVVSLAGDGISTCKPTTSEVAGIPLPASPATTGFVPKSSALKPDASKTQDGAINIDLNEGNTTITIDKEGVITSDASTKRRKDENKNTIKAASRKDTAVTIEPTEESSVSTDQSMKTGPKVNGNETKVKAAENKDVDVNVAAVMNGHGKKSKKKDTKLLVTEPQTGDWQMKVVYTGKPAVTAATPGEEIKPKSAATSNVEVKPTASSGECQSKSATPSGELKTKPATPRGEEKSKLTTSSGGEKSKSTTPSGMEKSKSTTPSGEWKSKSATSRVEIKPTVGKSPVKTDAPSSGGSMSLEDKQRSTSDVTSFTQKVTSTIDIKKKDDDHETARKGPSGGASTKSKKQTTNVNDVTAHVI
ncbi:uncharacterized protein LOC141909664 [Tubulanus polymorphus]|uniref:uncharacterized protein LOC141909664 n=1 Tax=Tubulanus polymorphus TaxID=672921 RepID=UPI003DA686E2